MCASQLFAMESSAGDSADSEAIKDEPRKKNTWLQAMYACGTWDTGQMPLPSIRKAAMHGHWVTDNAS